MAKSHVNRLLLLVEILAVVHGNNYHEGRKETCKSQECHMIMMGIESEEKEVIEEQKAKHMAASLIGVSDVNVGDVVKIREVEN